MSNNETVADVAQQFEGNPTVELKSVGIFASNGYWEYFDINDEGEIISDGRKGGWDDDNDKNAVTAAGRAELLYAFEEAGFDISDELISDVNE